MVPPSLAASWAVNAAVIASYALFRAPYAGSPCAAHSDSYLIKLGIAPSGATQEFDLILFTVVLAAQKWRRSSNVQEFVGTLLWYLQLAIGALLALTSLRPCVAYAALLTACWSLLPSPPVPMGGGRAFSVLTPYELAVLASRAAKESGCFGAAGGFKKDSAIVFAAASRGDEAAYSCIEAFRRSPNHQLFYADLTTFPEMAAELDVDLSTLSLELPSVLQLKPDGSGKADRRLPIKGEADGDTPARVKTVKLGVTNLRVYFDS